jgi:dolichyl-phosphate-mannose-protein mannosyltransferase
MKYHIPSDKSIILALLALGILVHALWFGHPGSAVFDEVHFGKFITAYFTHEYYFDIHPPLGKLILAGWGKLWGFQPGFSFANIGDDFPDNAYLALRFLPALAGALLPLVIYGVARRLDIGRAASFLAGALVALDNALLVQSRFILLDSFLLLFGFGALYAYLTWRARPGQGHSKWYLLAAGVLGGMAMGIKWTGMSFLAVIIVLELIHLWQDRKGTARRRLPVVVACLVVAPFLVYYAAFAAHFSLLWKSGPGDAFMTPSFQRDLEGSSHAADSSLPRLSQADKFLELNVEMYRSNQRLTATHPYSSKWYSWPLLARPIFYWVQNNARIYLLGNPVVWWGSTLAVLATAVLVVRRRVIHAPGAVLIMAGAWLLNLLPFIGISRVMFLYHYFIALVWAILMLAWFVDRWRKPESATLKIVGLALVAFIFFAPLSYGLGMSERARSARTWLNSWE